MSHLFTIQVSGIDLNRDYEDLHGAGCDDALIAVVDDVVYLDFAREAPSFDQAVESAKRDVARAGGQVVRIMPTPEIPDLAAAVARGYRAAGRDAGGSASGDRRLAGAGE